MTSAGLEHHYVVIGVSVKLCMYFSHMDAVHDKMKAKK